MDKYVEKGRFNSKKWIADNTIPVNEKLSSSAMKRMDGLHNVKAMKQLVAGAEVIVNDLVEEGFDEMEVLDYLIEKIKKSAF